MSRFRLLVVSSALTCACFHIIQVDNYGERQAEPGADGSADVAVDVAADAPEAATSHIFSLDFNNGSKASPTWPESTEPERSPNFNKGDVNYASNGGKDGTPGALAVINPYPDPPKPSDGNPIFRGGGFLLQRQPRAASSIVVDFDVRLLRIETRASLANINLLPADAPLSERRLIGISVDVSATTGADAGGMLTVQYGGVDKPETDPVRLADGQWHRVNVQLTLRGGTSAPLAEVRIDGRLAFPHEALPDPAGVFADTRAFDVRIGLATINPPATQVTSVVQANYDNLRVVYH